MAKISSGKSVSGTNKSVTGEGNQHNKVSTPSTVSASKVQATGKSQSYGMNAAKHNAYNADVAVDAGGSTGS